MNKHLSLPGLDRLMEVCRKSSLPMKVSPPHATAPQAGEPFFGYPFDPMLAAVYQRLGEATLGKLLIYSSDPSRYGLFETNKVRQQAEEPFRSCIVFGKRPQLAYYFGMVPALADAHGLQPVVYINYHPAEISAVPLASNVDRFFDTYSRYLERMVVDLEYIRSGVPELTFPWGVPELVATDELLMALVRAGRFDFLAQDNESAREWLQKLASTRR